MNVLVVDDEQPVRDLVAGIIRSVGHHVAVARNAAAALALSAESRYDLVISDIDMPPGVSGIDLAKELSKMKDPPWVILMSGRLEQHLREIEGSIPRLIGALKKPFGLRALRSIIGKVPEVEGPPS